jgi:hypothetical protein
MMMVSEALGGDRDAMATGVDAAFAVGGIFTVAALILAIAKVGKGK